MVRKKKLITKTKITQLKILKAISSKSKLTEKEDIELGRKINKSLHEILSKQNY